MKKRKLFCEYGPLCYKISLMKEYLLRDIKDMFSGEHFAKRRSVQGLEHIVKGHRSLLLRQLTGVDMQLQRNKVINLRLAAAKVDGLTVYPGETFSFWKTVGKVTAAKGYSTGMTLVKGRPKADVGGGLCQLANMVHWLVLNSPLTVTELHHHSDAVFPDSGRRVPFGTGTSVFYKNIDYRFKNTTDQPVQLRVWLDETDLCGELHSPAPYPNRYRIEEEGHCFIREGNDYYRTSRVYRRIISRLTGETLGRELILQNHSRVLYDHSLIPPDEMKQEETPYAVTADS